MFPYFHPFSTSMPVFPSFPYREPPCFQPLWWIWWYQNGVLLPVQHSFRDHQGAHKATFTLRKRLGTPPLAPARSAASGTGLWSCWCDTRRETWWVSTRRSRPASCSAKCLGKSWKFPGGTDLWSENSHFDVENCELERWIKLYIWQFLSMAMEHHHL